MFFQPPEQPTTNEKSSASLKSTRRKRKKRERERAQKIKNKTQALNKEKQRFAQTMSSWAASFSMGATWQLNHQVAYWKSRAKTLEYENNMLRTMLRQYYIKGEPSQDNKSPKVISRMDYDSDEDEDPEEDVEEDVEEEEEDENEIEVSKEFVDFLKDNIEHRKLRQERARLRQLEEDMAIKNMEACPEVPTDNQEQYENQYGARWQQIAALEMSMQSQYISDCDKDKPALWPYLPLRM